MNFGAVQYPIALKNFAFLLFEMGRWIEHIR
jgi:hypothetical protein